MIPPAPDQTSNRHGYTMSRVGCQDRQGLTVTVLPRWKPKRESSEDEFFVSGVYHLPRDSIGELSTGSGGLRGERR